MHRSGWICLADLKFDTNLSGFDLNMQLPELNFKLPDLGKPAVCPFCGNRG
jgi:hypothetical protein